MRELERGDKNSKSLLANVLDLEVNHILQKADMDKSKPSSRC